MDNVSNEYIKQPLSLEDRMRIIQEIVPGKQITLAHIIANPDTSLYEKVFDRQEDIRGHRALGMVIMSPSESVVIAGDLALKTASVTIEVIDYRNGTLMINGKISEVEAAIGSIAQYCSKTLGFTVCEITKS